MNQGSISTDLGLLKATVREDPDYPGIDIRLERGGQDVLLAWVEVNMITSSPLLQMRLYADMEDDEPTDSHTLTPPELDRYFAAIGGDLVDKTTCEKAVTDDSKQETAASWAGYCQYLKEWAESHSDAGFAGCCPACYDEFLNSEWQEYREQMNGKQDEV